MIYYKSSKEDVLKNLETTESGLDDEQVKDRLQKYGLNKLKEAKKNSLLSKFIEQFKNLMLIILIIAAIISAVVAYVENTNEYIDTIVILFVVFLNAILGVIQESKAEKAIEALKEMSLPYIKVKRNGNVASIKTEELVVGDIVLLEAGDSVPADMRIIKNHSIRVEESALTGESLPVDKTDHKIRKMQQKRACRNHFATRPFSRFCIKILRNLCFRGADGVLGELTAFAQFRKRRRRR